MADVAGHPENVGMSLMGQKAIALKHIELLVGIHA
jgi:hypothetical protein